MDNEPPPKDGNFLTPEECQELREAARDLAMKGNPICGGYFALRDIPMARFIDDLSDYADDEEDIRPY